MENIICDFVVGLLKAKKKYYVIWVVVHLLTKSIHFILVWMNQLVKHYIDDIMRLHNTPASIVSDKDNKFIARV